MHPIKKALNKMTPSQRARMLEAMRKIRSGDLIGKKLSSHANHYRVRIGNFRIIYVEAGESIEIKKVVRRSEKTYRF